MQINKNAVDLLIAITEQREWHCGKLSVDVAHMIKKRARAGGVSYKKAVEILEMLGYVKIQDEIWEMKIQP